MSYLFFELLATLNLTIHELDKLKNAAINEKNLRLMHELMMVHVDIFKVIEQVEKLDYEYKQNKQK